LTVSLFSTGQNGEFGWGALSRGHYEKMDFPSFEIFGLVFYVRPKKYFGGGGLEFVNC
jgi:hypothetical protein